MFDVIDSLRGGFDAADQQLRAAQRAVAHAQVAGGEGADAAMARMARSVIFSEALLGAARARLQEMQTAAKT